MHYAALKIEFIREFNESPIGGRPCHCSSLGSNACFEAALAIGILSDGILIGGSRIKAHGSHSFIGLLALDFAAFAASAGIAAPTSGTRTAKANRDFKLNMLASLFKG
jgi:hypothetical protein